MQHRCRSGSWKMGMNWRDVSRSCDKTPLSLWSIAELGKMAGIIRTNEPKHGAYINWPSLVTQSCNPSIWSLFFYRGLSPNLFIQFASKPPRCVNICCRKGRFTKEEI